MAIITVSRQLASRGDEVSSEVAKQLGYRFVGRKEIEERIVYLGFPADKLRKYDEKKPGFFASLAKNRDEYLDYLQTAILEAAAENNCVLVGRGSFIILSELENHLSFRFVANNSIRIDRLMKSEGISEKQALKKINENDANRLGFHKSFFNYQTDDVTLYHAIVNTGLLDLNSAVSIVIQSVKSLITAEKEKSGEQMLERLLICQRIVNMLVFDYRFNINFLRAEVRGHKIVLRGVADSSAIVARALTVVQCEVPEYKVESEISVVQDFKAYQ